MTLRMVFPNPDGVLLPGMFVRATLVLATESDAVLVPESALARRDGIEGVFATDVPFTAVRWVPVEIGLKDTGRMQLLGPPPGSHVVVLGHQFLADGARIVVPDSAGAPAPTAAEPRGAGQ